MRIADLPSLSINSACWFNFTTNVHHRARAEIERNHREWVSVQLGSDVQDSFSFVGMDDL